MGAVDGLRSYVEVLAMPGHTPGSVAILNREEQYIFTGDAVSESLMLTGYERERIESSYRGLSICRMPAGIF
ncbi:MAG: hypothetical protein LUH00_08735 [Lachnospiraceae bacterium]|nr:hypothetical protein [Lachnospiraceae bacterium]